MRRAWTFELLLIASSWSPLVHAQAPAAAEALFREAKTLLEAGDHDAACPKLEQSQRLDPAVGTMALLAYCHAQQGKLATAWQEYSIAAAMARDAGQKDREQVARDQAKQLEARLSKLTIVVEAPVPGLEVTRMGRPVARAEWGVAVPVDPGTVEVAARAPGHTTWSKTVEVATGPAELEVRVPALTRIAAAPASEPAPPPVRPATPAPADEGSWLGENAAAVIVLGIGTLAIGTGAYLGLRAKSKHDESNDKHCDDRDRCTDRGLALRDEALEAATWSNVAFGVGAVAVGTGIVLLLSSGGEPASRGSVGLAPILGPNAGGAAVRAEF